MSTEDGMQWYAEDLALCMRCYYEKENFVIKWELKISSLKENRETLRLTMFTDCLKKLIPEKSLECCVPKELSTYVLESLEQVKVQYDPDKSIVIDIERI